MLLSSVPTLRRKKGTEKLAPISCAHAEAEEGAQAGVRRITAKVKTVICEQAPNHGSYFAYARLIARVTFNSHL